MDNNTLVRTEELVKIYHGRRVVNGVNLDVKRGEIVIFVPPHQQQMSYVKRCVGVPGDSVQVIAKRVYINGQLTEVPFSYGRLTALAGLIGLLQNDGGGPPT